MATTVVIQQRDLVETGQGIFYAARPLPITDASLVAFLKQTACAIPPRRARFCAHPAADAAQHDMLIACHRDSYVPPHRHLDKTESFVVLEGVADVLLFGESGKLETVLRMGPLSTGRPFFYRMPARRYHSLSIESEWLVFVESTIGPFRPDASENAPWAPSPDQMDLGRAFIAAALQSARGT